MKSFLKSKKLQVLAVVALLGIFGSAGYTGYQTLKTSETISSMEESLAVTENSDKTERIQLANDTSEIDENGYADYEAMKRPTLAEIKEAQAHVDDLASYYIGTVEIPSIDLNINILEGTTYERMLYAATTILPDSEMGKGNYALASHNMAVEGSMFTSLYRVQVGDDIYLKDKSGKEFHYKTKSVEVVNYKDTTCLEEQDKAVVTLVTCQSVRDTTNRVVVQGELINS